MVKSISQLVLLSLVFGACVMFSAAVSAETPTADANAGRELYKIAGGYGCGVCHGKVGDGGGQAGGRVRGATTELFNTALAIQPTMMLLVNALDAQNRADLVAYLESLALMPLVTMAYDGMAYDGMAWTIVQEPASKGQTVQLLVFNDSFEDLTLDLSAFGLASLVVAPMETQVVDWIAETGSYFLPDDSLFVVSEELVCIH